eukprot:gnl/Carplike_NY0171/2632_a3534_534.p1 GENE.gnl/Carplike_NY0171/2632_a3534_534~~gnl/Carplike_NY0171/2632_a3534_534.p1  ORF type:complete len:287 (+),score=72.37 gnl/Carplike_NY0171/2632_a3534_534:609-1469(+)
MIGSWNNRGCLIIACIVLVITVSWIPLIPLATNGGFLLLFGLIMGCTGRGAGHRRKYHPTHFYNHCQLVCTDLNQMLMPRGLYIMVGASCYDTVKLSNDTSLELFFIVSKIKPRESRIALESAEHLLGNAIPLFAAAKTAAGVISSMSESVSQNNMYETPEAVISNAQRMPIIGELTSGISRDFDTGVVLSELFGKKGAAGASGMGGSGGGSPLFSTRSTTEISPDGKRTRITTTSGSFSTASTSFHGPGQVDQTFHNPPPMTGGDNGLYPDDDMAYVPAGSAPYL